MTNASATSKNPTVLERIQSVADGLGKIPATGKNPFGNEAVSIGDVEAAIRPLLTKEGVLTFWSYVSLQPLDKGDWMAHLRVRLQNASDEKDLHEDEWIDIGNSPMAATSFARKGYYKALFHIAEPNDDALDDKQPPKTRGRVVATAPPVEEIPGTDRPFRERDLCPACALDGNKTTRGGRPAFFIPKQGPHAGVLQCNGRAEGGRGAWLNHIPAISPQEAATADDNPANEAEIPA